MKKNILEYKKTIKENLSDIKIILKDLKLANPNISIYEDILSKSSLFITSKWESGKKYSRTLFIQEVLNKNYPKKYTQLSLSVDAIVNILDDLLDEDITKKEKEIYVIEFLRIFSVYSKKTNLDVEIFLSIYINKLITLAIAENFYKREIKKEKNIDIIVEKSADLLICRGMDIDIFLQIGLLNKKKELNNKNIQNIARIFRAINILKKDINDIEHDIKNNAETIVINILNNKKIDFKEYILKLINYFETLQKYNFNLILNKKDKFSLDIANNFQKIFNKEKRYIQSKLD